MPNLDPQLPPPPQASLQTGAARSQHPRQAFAEAFVTPRACSRSLLLSRPRHTVARLLRIQFRASNCPRIESHSFHAHPLSHGIARPFAMTQASPVLGNGRI